MLALQNFQTFLKIFVKILKKEIFYILALTNLNNRYFFYVIHNSKTKNFVDVSVTIAEFLKYK